MACLPNIKMVFCDINMHKAKKTYTSFQKLSCVCLMMLLAWLTISAPFIARAKAALNKQQKAFAIASSAAEEENADSTGKNTGEKVSADNTLTEEFLHEHQSAHHFFSPGPPQQKHGNADDYTAFHSELHVPPPNAI